MSVATARLPLERSRRADWIELTKPRITGLILMTVMVGYYLGAAGVIGLVVLPALAGTALITSGTAVLNQYMERDVDARMRRTENRPLPAGRLAPGPVLVYGLLLSVLGLAVLFLWVNLLTAQVAALTSLSYLLLYTPLKQVTTLCTVVGAIPGALPPVGGWAAATGQLDAGAAILFIIVFLWQMPHFLAIAWLYRDDYRDGGMAMLPSVESSGRFTALQVVLYAAALLPASLAPAAMGLAGGYYLVGSLLLGLLFLGQGIRFARQRTAVEARRLLLASVIYLPLLWVLLLADRSGG